MEKLQTKKMLKKKKGIDSVTTKDLKLNPNLIVKETGKPVYESSEGRHSEIGRSIPLDGKFYNIPSIQDGKILSEDELKEGIKSGKLKPTSVHDSLPEAVKDRGSRYKGVQYDKIIPLLIEGIKELKEKVKHIEENCDCLKK